MSGNQNKLIAFNYFGGKFTWLEHLYAAFPTGFTYLVDLFAGSMVSGYDCPLMRELYGDWHLVRFPLKRNNIRSNIGCREIL